MGSVRLVKVPDLLESLGPRYHPHPPPRRTFTPTKTLLSSPTEPFQVSPDLRREWVSFPIPTQGPPTNQGSVTTLNLLVRPGLSLALKKTSGVVVVLSRGFVCKGS